MAELLASKEFWAALVGGAFSLVGAYLSFFVKMRSDKIERIGVIKLFSIDHVDQMVLVNNSIISFYDSNKVILFDYSDQQKILYDIYIRNAEQMMLLEDSNIRLNVRRFFNESYSLVKRLEFFQREIYRLSEIKNIDETKSDEDFDKERGKKFEDVTHRIRNLVVDLKRISVDGTEVKNKLIALK